MYADVQNSFNRNLTIAATLKSRPDTLRALDQADDKGPFLHNLEKGVVATAFDRTVAYVARHYRTTNLDQIRAILRRSGVLASYRSRMH